MPWIVCLAQADAASLAPLRLHHGIEVAENGFVWLRGSSKDDKLEPLLCSLPAVARYELSPHNRLQPFGSRIPSETLPTLQWQPLKQWLQVRMPSPPLSPFRTSAASPAVADLPAAALQTGPLSLPRVPLRIIRSADERPPDLLLTNLAEWQAFALNAPEIRLRQLRFAADAAGNVVVHGRPLPPLPGTHFVLDGNIAVPAGFSWEPPVSSEVLSRCLGISSEALAFLHPDGTFTRIEGEQFVPATRSAVRETAAHES